MADGKSLIRAEAEAPGISMNLYHEDKRTEAAQILRTLQRRKLRRQQTVYHKLLIRHLFTGALPLSTGPYERGKPFRNFTESVSVIVAEAQVSLLMLEICGPSTNV